MSTDASTVLNLALPAALSTPSLDISPVVLFNILDHYLRRDQGQRQVIGTLLGKRSEDGRIIAVRNSFAVPSEGATKKFFLNMDYHRSMLELHQRVNQKEVVVGWYSTGHELLPRAADVQEMYSEECPQVPLVHVLLDTRLNGERLGLKAFISSPIGFAQKPERSLLVPAAFEIRATDSERTGLDLLAQARGKEDRTASQSTELEDLERALRKVHAIIDRTICYVDSVNDGSVPANATVGRSIMEAVAVVPKLDETSFEAAFTDHLQDQLMIDYLATMAQAQVSIAESVHTLI